MPIGVDLGEFRRTLLQRTLITTPVKGARGNQDKPKGIGKGVGKKIGRPVGVSFDLPDDGSGSSGGGGASFTFDSSAAGFDGSVTWDNG